MTGILFIARLGSTRLPEKHLLMASGRFFIEWMVDRFATEFAREIQSGNVKLVIATSVLPENKKFEKVLKYLPLSIFYGDDQNIPKRQLQCAEALNLDNVISIDGDDILCSTSAARKVLDALETGDDFVKTSGLPLGMNCMGYNTAFLKEAVGTANADKLETGWGRIFEGHQVTDLNCFTGPVANIRMTLDYAQDADFFKSVISFFGEEIANITDSKLIDSIIENKYHEMNASLHEEYWANFNKARDAESTN